MSTVAVAAPGFSNEGWGCWSYDEFFFLGGVSLNLGGLDPPVVAPLVVRDAK